MIFVFLYYKGYELVMKTFTSREKDQAIQWHKEHPHAVMLLGNGPMPDGISLEMLDGDNS